MTTITIDRAVVEQALETIEGLTRDRLFTAEWAGKHGAAIAALRAALEEPVPHGCHVDLDDDMEPDGCVLDEGSPRKCVHADRLLREGKNKTACKYWKPIEVKR